ALQDPGMDPQNGSGWGVDAGDINTIQCQNASAAPTGNPGGTIYYFAASDSKSNASYLNGGITSSADGHTLIEVNNPGSASSGLWNELVTGNSIAGTLANTSYWVFAQACPSLGISPNDPTCSNWIRIS